MENVLLYVVLAMTAAAMIFAMVVVRKLNEIHLSMNSRLDNLLDVTGKLAKAEGFKAGKEEHLTDLKDAATRLK